MNSLGVQLVTFAVYALAVARVVRFINYDALFDPARIFVERHLLDARTNANGTSDPVTAAIYRRRESRWSTVTYFIGCPWCVSMWIAAGTVWIPMWHSGNKVAQYVGILLAVSYLVGLAAPLSADDDDVTIEDVETP